MPNVTNLFTINTIPLPIMEDPSQQHYHPFQQCWWTTKDLPSPLSAALEAALNTALLMLPPVMSNLASISKSTSSASGTSSGMINWKKLHNSNGLELTSLSLKLGRKSQNHVVFFNINAQLWKFWGPDAFRYRQEWLIINPITSHSRTPLMKDMMSSCGKNLCALMTSQGQGNP